VENETIILNMDRENGIGGSRLIENELWRIGVNSK